jgi:hypothetical protein
VLLVVLGGVAALVVESGDIVVPGASDAANAPIAGATASAAANTNARGLFNMKLILFLFAARFAAQPQNDNATARNGFAEAAPAFTRIQPDAEAAGYTFLLCTPGNCRCSDRHRPGTTNVALQHDTAAQRW